MNYCSWLSVPRVNVYLCAVLYICESLVFFCTVLQVGQLIGKRVNLIAVDVQLSLGFVAQLG